MWGKKPQTPPESEKSFWGVWLHVLSGAGCMRLWVHVQVRTVHIEFINGERRYIDVAILIGNESCMDELCAPPTAMRHDS